MEKRGINLNYKGNSDEIDFSVNQQYLKYFKNEAVKDAKLIEQIYVQFRLDITTYHY